MRTREEIEKEGKELLSYRDQNDGVLIRAGLRNLEVLLDIRDLLQTNHPKE